MSKSKKRNIVGEIIEVKERQRYIASIYDVQEKVREIKEIIKSRIVNNTELNKYFPIALVACLEAGFRLLIKGLIDHGKPYSDRANKIIGDIKFDYPFVASFHGTKISVGELVSHLVPISSFNHINSHMSDLLDLDYADELWKVEQFGKRAIDDKDRVYSGINRCFELRHVFCHEVTKKVTIEQSEAELLITDCESFLKAADALHLTILYPGPGLCQRDMNIQAGAELTEVENEISTVINDIKTHITGQRLREFRSAHKKWETYRNAYSTYLANCYKGGSVWPTVYCNHATYFSRKRLEELKQYLIELQEFEDIC